MLLHKKSKFTRYLSSLLAIIICLSFGLSFAVYAAEGSTSGTTYYVSDSVGNDENDGLSENAPWKSIERLAQVTLTAGDRVLFKAGDIWYGAYELDLSGGEKDNPITFSSYGEGNKPSLRYYRGPVTIGATGICLKLNNPNGFVMDGLAVGYANCGVKIIYDKEYYESDYVRFTNCHFHDIYGVNQLDHLDEIYFSAAIYTDHEGHDGDSEGNGWPLRGLYIDNCTAYDAGSMVCGPSGVYGFYMTDCVAEECGSYGTTAFGCQKGYIERCIFRNNGSRHMPAGSCGIMISATDFVVRNCIISGQQRQGSDPDGCGIDFEWDCHNVLVENCLFLENAGVGIMYFTSGQEENGTNYDTHIRNCYFIDNNVNIGNVGGFDIIATDYAMKDCEVTGNKYIVTDFKKSETVDFYRLDDNNDALFENNEPIDEIPENLEAMILHPELFDETGAVPSGDSSGDSSEDSSMLVYCVIAAGLAIVLSLCFWLIIKFAVKKKSV